MKHHIVIAWDVREQIDLDAVNRALAKIKNARLFEVNTGGDVYAVVVAPAGTSQADAQASMDEIMLGKKQPMEVQPGEQNFNQVLRARAN